MYEVLLDETLNKFECSQRCQILQYSSNFVFFILSFTSDDSLEEGMSGLGSPSDPCLSPLAWSVTGKYLASAMEKMVNIWQVNGKEFILSILLWGLLNMLMMSFTEFCRTCFTIICGSPRITGDGGLQHMNERSSIKNKTEWSPDVFQASFSAPHHTPGFVNHLSRAVTGVNRRCNHFHLVWC